MGGGKNRNARKPGRNTPFTISETGSRARGSVPLEADEGRARDQAPTRMIHPWRVDPWRRIRDQGAAEAR